MDKEYLKSLSIDIELEMNEERFGTLSNEFYNSDFIVVSDENMDDERDHRLKKFIKKVGLLKEEGGVKKFYQLFYYLKLMFNVKKQNGMVEKKPIRIIVLNNEITKFIDVCKKFIDDFAEFKSKKPIEAIMNYRFINKIFIEDYKIFTYKSKLCSALKKMNYVDFAKYKSFKFINKDYDVNFDILKNDDYYSLDQDNIQNSKLKVISNFLYMLQDLEVLDSFN